MNQDMEGNIHFIQNSGWQLLQQQIKACTGKLYVLLDENTMQYCYPILLQSIAELKRAELIEIEAREESKNLQIAIGIWESLSEQNAGRDTLFINLGGGVVSDLGGFVASTYKRGIPFINVPTSLLAMVDAAIGGKTGIDFMDCKNQLGTFAQALSIFIWPEFLNSLPQRELLSGQAESIKHALIADSDLWEKFSNMQIEKISSLELIQRSLKVKTNIVARDPMEKGARKLLNFGHTIGHALESYFLSRRETVLHGEAVAAGMICEAYISLKKTSFSSLSAIEKHIDSLFPRIGFSEMEITSILQFMVHDKKNVAGRNRFVLLEEIGKAIYDCEVEEELIRESLIYYLNPKHEITV